MSAGILNQISFGVESAFGTPVTPNKSLAVHPGDGIQTDIDLKTPESLKGLLAKHTTAHKGLVKRGGDYELDIAPGNIAYLFKSVFGSVSSAQKAGETVVYEHTFSESASKPSLTIEQAIGEVVERYAGSIVTELSFACKTGETLIGKVSVLAKSQASASKVTPAVESLRPFNFSDCLSADGFRIGGVTLDNVENFELTYSNNGQMNYALGSANPARFTAGGSEVAGKFDLYLDSTSASKYADYLSKTEQSLDVTFTGDSIGSSSNYKLSIVLPRVVFKTASTPVNDDYNLLSVEFQGMYDTVTAKLISTVLTNLTSSV